MYGWNRKTIKTNQRCSNRAFGFISTCQSTIHFLCLKKNQHRNVTSNSRELNKGQERGAHRSQSKRIACCVARSFMKDICAQMISSSIGGLTPLCPEGKGIKSIPTRLNSLKLTFQEIKQTNQPQLKSYQILPKWPPTIFRFMHLD